MENLFSVTFPDTLIRFFICLFVTWFIVHFLYFKKAKRRDFYFTFIIISVAIFFLVYLMMGMDRGKATMGVGLGLFGIFSIMRYRTDSMPVREMTYLFVVVCLSVVHAMADNLGADYPAKTAGTPLAELISIDVVIIAVIYVFELRLKVEAYKLIQYDRIELIEPEKRQELIADIKQRTGLKVTKIDVGAIDFLHDMVMLRVKYQPDGTADRELDNKFKIKNSEYANN